MLGNIGLKIAVLTLSFLQNISKEKLQKCIELVVDAATKFSDNKDKFHFVVDELGKLFKELLPKDAAGVSNDVYLLISLAIKLANMFGLWKTDAATNDK